MRVVRFKLVLFGHQNSDTISIRKLKLLSETSKYYLYYSLRLKIVIC